MPSASLCIVAIAILLLLFYVTTLEPVQVKSDLDKRYYDVVDDFGRQKQAANLLAEINRFNQTLIKNLKEKYGDSGDPFISGLVDRLVVRYRRESLTENLPDGKHDTSYVLNKGKTLSLCLRHLPHDGDRFIDWNTLQFVNLHELSHVATENHGHDRTFWKTFKFLLTEAKDQGLYNPVDYSEEPIRYCSLPLKKNPFFVDIPA